jgi:predicted RNA-binding protein
MFVERDANFNLLPATQVLPEDVMIISPYKDQVKLVDKVFCKRKFDCHDNLTVNASQSQDIVGVIKLKHVG